MKIIRLSSGLGNQMFMYAFFLHIKQKYQNEEVFFDDKYFKNDQSGRKSEIEILFPNYPIKKMHFNPAGEKHFLKEVYKRVHAILYKLKYINEDEYQDNIFYAGDCYLDGYWQNLNYIYQIPKKLFLPKEEIPEELSSLKDTIQKLKDPVCIHFRRGDYFSPIYIDRFGVCTENYYNRAMNRLEKDVPTPTYVVFTDDQEWVKKNINFKYKTLFVPNYKVNSYWYIYLMSLCKHNIISNSTFSWWGAYLNNHSDQKVYGPDVWTFGSEKSLMCNNWIKIKTR